MAADDSALRKPLGDSSDDPAGLHKPFQDDIIVTATPLPLPASAVQQQPLTGGEDRRVSRVIEGDDLGGPQQLRRTLTAWDGIGVVVGIMIGSGIFASPGTALQDAGAAGSVLLAWVTAGALVGFGAMCYGELGAAIPNAAGDAEYLLRAYGEGARFVFAWSNFWVLKPGSQAIIATVFGQYLAAVFTGVSSLTDDGGGDEHEWLAKMLALAAIVSLTAVNCLGVRETSNVQNALTLLKFLLVSTLFTIGLWHGVSTHKGWHQLRANFGYEATDDDAAGAGPFSHFNPASFGRAMIACLWAYDGWADVGPMAEELKQPQWQLPVIVTSSVIIVALTYAAMNLAYLAVLSQETIEESNAVAIDFAGALSSAVAAKAFVAIGVCVSALGSCNGSMLTGGRVFFAVARDGALPSWMACLATLNSRGSPACALLFQGLWGAVLVLLPGSNFAALLDYFGPASWLFYALTASSTVVLRRKFPTLPRPFQMPLYPLPPLVVTVMALCLAASSLASSPLFCIASLAFVAFGFPVHWMVARSKAPRRSSGSAHTPLATEDSLDFA